jgi:hypothetical protein
MLYVDGLCNHGWFLKGKHVLSCHLYSDGGNAELISFAEGIGLKRQYMQRSRKGIAHFDLVESKRKRAVSRGAKEVTREEFVALMERIGNVAVQN